MSRHSDERDRFLDLLSGEIDRRRYQQLTEQGGDLMVALNRTLDEMRARLLAAPNYREPTPAQQRHNAHKVEMWFKRHGYLSR
jgi:hypothetical protein